MTEQGASRDALQALVLLLSSSPCVSRRVDAHDLAWTAGRMAAIEGVALSQPLLEQAQASEPPMWRGCGWMGLRWSFDLAYWTHAPIVQPDTFFELTPPELGRRWVGIASRGCANGAGCVTLHESQLSDFFGRARMPMVGSYDGWANDDHPVGGRAVLLRMDSIQEGDELREQDWELQGRRGSLQLDPDTHPSSGHLNFGDPEQELQQLGALLRLEAHVRNLLQRSALTPEMRDAARESASAIRSAADAHCFFPSSGICSVCNTDLTSVVPAASAAALTGCPACLHAWCD